MTISQAVRAHMHKERDRLIDGMIEAALDVLHHDRSPGSDVDRYERDALRKRFVSVFERS